MSRQAKYMYTDGRIHSANRPNLSSRMHAFNYGTAAFEGMKAFYYKNENSWYLFRPDEHFRRIKQSASVLDLNFNITLKKFIESISRLIHKNNIKEDIYIRPLVYHNHVKIGLTNYSGYGVTIFMEPKSLRQPQDYSCCLSSYRRPVDGQYNVKISGNYMLSFLAQKEAKSKRADLALMLSSDGYLSETSVMNLFFVKNGTVYTPSLNCGALAGITRKSINTILRKELIVPVKEGRYRYKTILGADEVFTTGTGSGINRIVRIDKKRFRKSKKSFTDQLFEIYRNIVNGRDKRYSDWLTGI